MLKRILWLTLALMLMASAALADVQVGDIITFGRYPQTESGKDRTPVEWIVLEVDAENSSALLLSRYCLDAKYYYHKYKACTWKKSTVREWLNNKFLSTAFNPQEKKAIRNTMVVNGTAQACPEYGLSAGPDTKDKVFLLSYAEAVKYFGLHAWSEEADDAAIACRAVPTAYAVAKKAYQSSEYLTADGQGACPWALRSLGLDQVNISGVGVHGMATNFGIGATYLGIRPALWLNLKLYQAQ